MTSANGRPAVKLSDNPAKAMGEPAEIARYLRIFGGDGRVDSAVAVEALRRYPLRAPPTPAAGAADIVT